ncbi:7-cyano-7-deazaguanine synthase [Candidatus Saccharibacteria bacterium]|nr:7-cyano-7-deazaguanine synthase [Candidatus Saccharibacteria bacterium]
MAQNKTPIISSDRKRTVVMFSGGIDSAAALWHVLHRPDEYGQVHVHHIHIKNLEARWKAEAMAVKDVLDYMREHAPTDFTYSQSTIEVPHFGNRFMYDVEAISVLSGYMTSRDPLITKVVIAATKTDFEHGAQEAVARAKKIHNAFHPEEEDHSARVKEYPHRDLSKKEVYKTVPPELAALTWSCRTPHYSDGKPVECGRCKTCKIEMQGIERPKSPGKRNASN